MHTIYIACPKEFFSGGPELAHQLCFELNQLRKSAKMCYYTSTQPVEIWDTSLTRYGCYKTECAASLNEVNQPNNIVIIPETMIQLYDIFSACQVHIWWMSVDNYYVTTSLQWQNRLLELIKKDNIYHFVQSYYAYSFCRDKLSVNEEHIFYLTDYINELYFEKLLPLNIHKDYIFYNPKKGYDITSLLIKSYPDYQWMPIINLEPLEIVKVLSMGKVYIDFGNHPGKDRIPREAALRGCCVITNREGAAQNDIDVPIPDKYKFDDVLSSFPAIINTIDNILNDYPAAFKEFGYYRTQIRMEKQKFLNEIINLCEILEL